MLCGALADYRAGEGLTPASAPFLGGKSESCYGVIDVDEQTCCCGSSFEFGRFDNSRKTNEKLANTSLGPLGLPRLPWTPLGFPRTPRTPQDPPKMV